MSANFVAVFLELETILYSHVEWTVILNGITQEKNKVLEGDINKTANFYKLERSMVEDMYTFKSEVEAEQQDVGPHQKHPLS